jgi:hypothetical protein
MKAAYRLRTDFPKPQRFTRLERIVFSISYMPSTPGDNPNLSLSAIFFNACKQHDPRKSAASHNGLQARHFHYSSFRFT